jgi:hypothetical protein
MYRNRSLTHSTGTGRRRGQRAVAALALVLSLSATGLANADSTSPGKNSVFVSAAGVPLTSFATTLTGTIQKGRRKTVLAIETMYSDAGSYPTPAVDRVLGTIVTVNGVQAQPNPQSNWQYLVDCGFFNTAPVACAVAGTFWLDIDAAELANPGSFVGQPLVVEFVAGDLTAGALVGSLPMDASMTVRVQKK